MCTQVDSVFLSYLKYLTYRTVHWKILRQKYFTWQFLDLLWQTYENKASPGKIITHRSHLKRHTIYILFSNVLVIYSQFLISKWKKCHLPRWHSHFINFTEETKAFKKYHPVFPWGGLKKAAIAIGKWPYSRTNPTTSTNLWSISKATAMGLSSSCSSVFLFFVATSTNSILCQL